MRISAWFVVVYTPVSALAAAAVSLSAVGPDFTFRHSGHAARPALELH
jgi:hypothetical protein